MTKIVLKKVEDEEVKVQVVTLASDGLMSYEMGIVVGKVDELFQGVSFEHTGVKQEPFDSYEELYAYVKNLIENIWIDYLIIDAEIIPAQYRHEWTTSLEHKEFSLRSIIVWGITMDMDVSTERVILPSYRVDERYLLEVVLIYNAMHWFAKQPSHNEVLEPVTV